MVYMLSHCFSKRMSLWGEFESAVLNGVITGDRRWCVLADRIAVKENITEEGVLVVKRKVERWLRTRGFLKMLAIEEYALRKIQAVSRRFLVRNSLWRRYIIMERLSLDNYDHTQKAISILKVLQYTKN
jgi:hypothetical protein